MKKITVILALLCMFCLGSSSSVLASPASLSFLKTKNISHQTKNKFSFKYSSLKPANTPILNPNLDLKNSQKTPTIVENSVPASPQPQFKTVNLSLSIPKIGIEQQELSLASVANMADLDQKLLYKPILDTLTSQPCLPKVSTYIMGHSEPANTLTNNKPAVRVFENLYKLSSGDTVLMQNQAGNSCKYKIIGSQIVSTTLDGDVSQNMFNDLYFPKVEDSSILKIQTCVKGSATKRLVLTAILV